MKKFLCCLALVGMLIPFVAQSAAAQATKAAPVPSLDWMIATRPVPGTLSVEPVRNEPPPQPGYCAPCLFYGGDINPSSSLANGFANANTLAVPDTTVYVAFNVPGGQTWEVSGLFTNNLAVGYQGIDPQQATWSISTGISVGNGGTTVASGTASARFTQTGRNAFGYNEYTCLVQLSNGVHLTPGHYWLSVVPQCTNSSNSFCTTGGNGLPTYYFLSNTQGTNAFGPPEPLGQGYFNSSYFGYTYANVCTLSTTGCRELSGGVIGKSVSH